MAFSIQRNTNNRTPTTACNKPNHKSQKSQQHRTQQQTDPHRHQSQLERAKEKKSKKRERKNEEKVSGTRETVAGQGR